MDKNPKETANDIIKIFDIESLTYINEVMEYLERYIYKRHGAIIAAHQRSIREGKDE